MNKPYDLEERLIDFAVEVINVVEELPGSKAGNHIGLFVSSQHEDGRRQ
jgi:hypothetical protein